MRSALVSVSILALCSVSGVAATTKLAGPSPVRHLPAPKDVSLQARRALTARLAHHATSMQTLLRAVVLLDRPTVKVLADQIEREQTFSAAAISSLNIPTNLIGEGAAFAAAARDLAFVAATGSNDDVLADRFVVLTRTCVSCHSGYLHGARKRNPVDFPASPL